MRDGKRGGGEVRGEGWRERRGRGEGGGMERGGKASAIELHITHHTIPEQLSPPSCENRRSN